MKGAIALSLPFPPSVNTYWRAPNKGPLKGRHLVSARGRKYKTAVMASVIEHYRRFPQPITAEINVEVMLYPPDERGRDIDNYNKALFDSLTNAGVWRDDRQIKRMVVEWGPITKGGRVEISITQREAA